MPSHDGGSLLAARGLARAFGRVRILHGIDLFLQPGEVLAVLGPNGAGKTTLLRLLAGLMRPSAGEVLVLGRPLDGAADHRRSAIGFLSHQSLLYDDLTLEENLTFAAQLHGVARPREAAMAAIGAAGLAERSAELPKRLSRGLLQRVAIARTLLHSPRILLLDEPFTGLDAIGSERLRTELGTRLRAGVGAVVVTHHLSEIWDLATRVAVLIDGRWAMEESKSGSLDNYLNRYNEMTRA
jgi:heme ABC exporter ATP-binding subunit CcmA